MAEAAAAADVEQRKLVVAPETDSSQLQKCLAKHNVLNIVAFTHTTMLSSIRIKSPTQFEVYPVPNPDGSPNRPVLKFEEESNFFLRQLCGMQASLTLNGMTIMDSVFRNYQEPSIQLRKPFRRSCCCFAAESGCLGKDYMEVLVKGIEVGSIRNVNRWEYEICDGDDVLLCSLRSHTTSHGCCGCTKVFHSRIFDASGVDTGKEILTGTDFYHEETCKSKIPIIAKENVEVMGFEVQFPEYMESAEHKVLLLAAAILLYSKKR